MATKRTPTFIRTNTAPLGGGEEQQADYIAGHAEGGDATHNLEGCPLACEAVLVRRPPGGFHLHVKVGQRWFTLMDVQADDPGVKALREEGRMIEVGPSPHQVEAKRRKEETERRKREAEEAYRRQREEHHRQLQERARERRAGKQERTAS